MAAASQSWRLKPDQIAYGQIEQFDEIPDADDHMPPEVARFVANPVKPLGEPARPYAVAGWIDGRLVKWLIY